MALRPPYGVVKQLKCTNDLQLTLIKQLAISRVCDQLHSKDVLGYVREAHTGAELVGP